MRSRVRRSRRRGCGPAVGRRACGYFFRGRAWPDPPGRGAAAGQGRARRGHVGRDVGSAPLARIDSQRSISALSKAISSSSVPAEPPRVRSASPREGEAAGGTRRRAAACRSIQTKLLGLDHRRSPRRAGGRAPRMVTGTTAAGGVAGSSAQKKAMPGLPHCTVRFAPLAEVTRKRVHRVGHRRPPRRRPDARTCSRFLRRARGVPRAEGRRRSIPAVEIRETVRLPPEAATRILSDDRPHGRSLQVAGTCAVGRVGALAERGRPGPTPGPRRGTGTPPPALISRGPGRAPPRRAAAAAPSLGMSRNPLSTAFAWNRFGSARRSSISTSNPALRMLATSAPGASMAVKIQSW